MGCLPMPTLTIRDLPPELYGRLKDRAKRHRRSITQEALSIIEEAVLKAETPEEVWRQVEHVREMIRGRYGTFPDSTVLLRKDRLR